jgi:hypothetical protein
MWQVAGHAYFLSILAGVRVRNEYRDDRVTGRAERPMLNYCKYKCLYRVGLTYA